jgi:peptidoglycan/LPS O-acetylase OafA/YrhL
LPHHPKTHYLPLDSIRGIAALSIVVHHFVISRTFIAAFPEKAWIDVAYFHNAWLFVDLFFVLSGMVISLGYVQADLDDFSPREFLVRRLARIYPLHIVTLLAMLILRLAKLGLVGAGLLHVPPADFEVNNAYSFFLNVFLLQSLGFIDYLSWNGPSWSISTEFYTYLLFGAVLLCAQRLGSRRSFYAASLLLAAGSWFVIVVWLGKHSLEFHYDFGLIRCVMSFFIGVLTVKIVSDRPHITGRTMQATLQLAALLACVVVVCLVGSYPELSLGAPLVFALLLGSLMAFPVAWPLPGVLAATPLVWLGKRSYSIYMVHAAVLLVLEYAVSAFGPQRLQKLDVLLPGLSATLTLMFLVTLVLALSELTFKYVEGPGSRIVRRLFSRESALGRALVVDAGAGRS